MWDIRPNVSGIPELPDRFVVEFRFQDAPEEKQRHWLVFTEEGVNLCYIDPDLEIDVTIETDSQTMTKVWMGWNEPSTVCMIRQLTAHSSSVAP